MMWIWVCWLLVHNSNILAHVPSKIELKDYECLLFDRSIPEYETVLTPEDFEQAAELVDSSYYNKYDTNDPEAMYEKNLFEGDIANKNLNASTVEMFLTGGAGTVNGSWYNAIKNRHQLWPDGRIPYTISSQYSSYSRSQIAASMQEYSNHTCVQWVPKTDDDVNYVYIFPDRGCYSMVGKIGGKQSLSLGAGCIQKGIIIHEMMHAVGFFHEQSRTDRDDFITILWNNIQPGMQGQFEKYGQGTIQTLGTNYDYSSIMHYGGKAFSRNGQPTMIPKQKGVQIGQRGGFSKTDIYKINKLYGCPEDEVTTERSTTITTTTTDQTTTTATTTTTVSMAVVIPTSTSLPSSTFLPPIISECKNLRGDCNDLRDGGWCQRNPCWMKAHCPASCGFCGEKPEIIGTLPPTISPPSDCEDLRVDCLVLVSQRFCKISQSFMRTYCAKSCGFCYKPPPLEVGDLKSILTPLTTSMPIITRWRTSSLRPRGYSGSTSSSATINPLTQKPCKDQKHFCNHWKMAGFCEGIFKSYMKRNCAASCRMC